MVCRCIGLSNDMPTLLQISEVQVFIPNAVVDRTKIASSVASFVEIVLLNFYLTELVRKYELHQLQLFNCFLDNSMQVILVKPISTFEM